MFLLMREYYRLTDVITLTLSYERKLFCNASYHVHEASVCVRQQQQDDSDDDSMMAMTLRLILYSGKENPQPASLRPQPITKAVLSGKSSQSVSGL